MVGGVDVEMVNVAAPPERMLLGETEIDTNTVEGVGVGVTDGVGVGVGIGLGVGVVDAVSSPPQPTASALGSHSAWVSGRHLA